MQGLIKRKQECLSFDIAYPTTGAALTTINWNYRLIPQAQIVVFHRDLFNLMVVYFNTHTKHKHRYHQSINDQTPTTQFNKQTLQSTTATTLSIQR